jgi:hypothetical protein
MRKVSVKIHSHESASVEGRVGINLFECSGHTYIKQTVSPISEDLAIRFARNPADSLGGDSEYTSRGAYHYWFKSS